MRANLQPESATVLRNAVFLCFGLAALVTVGAVMFARLSPLFLPLPVLLLPLFVAVALWAFSGTAHHYTAIIAALAVTFIDLGFGQAQSVALALKGLAYLLAFVLGVARLPQLLRRLDFGETVVLLLAAWAWLSAVYSVDWWTSAYTGFGLMALVLVSLVIGTLPAEHLAGVLRRVATLLGAMVAVSVVFSVAFPHLAIATEVAGAGRYSGLLGSPNSAGGMAGLALVLNTALLLWRAEPDAAERRWLPLLFVATAAAMLVLSGSRNAMLSTGLTLVLLAGIRWPRMLLAALAASAVAVLVVSALGLWGKLLDGAVDLLSRQRHGFDVRNLTGRLEIWAFVIERWLDSPWIGYGLGGSRTVISSGFATYWGKTTGTAHNALLESLLDLGLVGTVLLFAFVGWVAVGAARLVRFGKHGSLLHNVAGLIVFYVLMFGIVEKSFAGTPSTATGGLLLAAAIVAGLRRAGRCIGGA